MPRVAAETTDKIPQRQQVVADQQAVIERDQKRRKEEIQWRHPRQPRHELIPRDALRLMDQQADRQHKQHGRKHRPGDRAKFSFWQRDRRVEERMEDPEKTSDSALSLSSYRPRSQAPPQNRRAPSRWLAAADFRRARAWSHCPSGHRRDRRVAIIRSDDRLPDKDRRDEAR